MGKVSVTVGVPLGTPVKAPQVFPAGQTPVDEGILHPKYVYVDQVQAFVAWNPVALLGRAHMVRLDEGHSTPQFGVELFIFGHFGKHLAAK